MDFIIRFIIHYENFPMQYIETFFTCKNENFTRQKLDIFNILAQNIQCRYTLERVPTMYVLDKKK